MSDFYFVVCDSSEGACNHCHRGSFWTIAHKENGEEIGIGQSWGDQEVAQDICDLMNMAYDAGQESQIDNAEEEKLVAFFRSAEGYRLGRDGDHDGLTPAETAIRAIRRANTSSAEPT